MSIFDKIKEKPFLLSDSDVQWVKDTLAGMTEKQKIGQIFCLCAREGTEQEIEDTLQVMEPGGIMYRPFTAEQAVNFTAMLDKAMKIPMLISANLELSLIHISEKFLSGQFASYHIYPYFPDYLGFQDVLGQEVPQKYRFMAVSYTHLDVYKRQPGSSCGI